MSAISPSGVEGPAFESLAEGGAACAVRLPIFEGPLDLLLHLIRQNELEVTDLPIARIAEQYLAYLELMQELHLDVAAEYLVMAATLAWIKSRLLLPVEADDDVEAGPDPRAELVARLLEYQRFKEVAEELGERPLLGRDVFEARPLPLEPPSEAEREVAVDLLHLLDALRRVLGRARAASVVHEVYSEAVTVRDRMLAVMEALERVETLPFEQVFETSDGRLPSRALIVATFLAILELARIAALRVFQSIRDDGLPEGPIRLRRLQESAGDWSARIAELA